jgi:hypothetical protein
LAFVDALGAAADGDSGNESADVDVGVDAAVSVGGANPNAGSNVSMAEATMAPSPVTPANDRP